MTYTGSKSHASASGSTLFSEANVMEHSFLALCGQGHECRPVIPAPHAGELVGRFRSVSELDAMRGHVYQIKYGEPLYQRDVL